MKPRRIKHLQAKSKKLDARVINPEANGEPFVVVVGSGSNPRLNRIVTIRFERNGMIDARCTCRWAQYGGVACTHVLAALQKLAARKKRSLSFWLTLEEAHRQKQSV